MTIRVVELFSGIGAQAQALKELGLDYEVVATADIDKHAIKGYEAIHGPVTNLGDVTKIEHLPECDLLTYSWPCLKADSKVLTELGWMPIIDIKPGMKVETDKGMREVLASDITGVQRVRKIVPSCGLPIVCTDYHPFLVRKRSHIWNNGRRSYDRVFSDPEYIQAKDISKDYYVGYPIPEEGQTVPKWDGIDLIWTDGRKTRHSDILSDCLYNENFWWTIGRYLADGWCNQDVGITIGFGKGKKNQITNIPFKTTICEERTVYKVKISSKELCVFCGQFGKSAKTKHIPEIYKHLPVNLAKSMLEGYLAGDGYFVKSENSFKCSTVSEDLALDLIQLIAYCYKTPSYLLKSERKPTCVIEGRVVNQNPTYVVSFKKDRRRNDKAFYEDGWIWSPIKAIHSDSDIMIPVYDITVEDRHCFNCGGIIVKNCTSISLAGRREGMKEGSGTASSLLWEVGRLLKDMKERNVLPDVLVAENVDAVLNKINKPEFDRWLGILSDLGYCNSYEILNAKDYGTPQNRRRMFMVSTLTKGEFIFPAPCPDGRVLRDVLEDDVPESYFLSEKRLATFKRHKERNDAKGNGFGFKIHELTDEEAERERGDYAGAVTGYADRYYQTWLGIPKSECQSESGIKVIGKFTDYDFNQCGKVYDTDGVSATIRTPTGGGLIPKIEVAGVLDRKFNAEKDVLSVDGLSKTITSEHHGSLSAPKIEVADDPEIPEDQSQERERERERAASDSCGSSDRFRIFRIKDGNG